MAVQRCLRPASNLLIYTAGGSVGPALPPLPRASLSPACSASILRGEAGGSGPRGGGGIAMMSFSPSSAW